MSSFRRNPDPRRRAYLALVGSIESQLRDIYALLHEDQKETQVTLAEKLGVSRSTVNKRLSGQHNMTIKTVADMVWALGHCIKVDIFDPAASHENSIALVENSSSQQGRLPTTDAASSSVGYSSKSKLKGTKNLLTELG